MRESDGPRREPPEPLRPTGDLRGTPVQDVEAHHIGEVYGALAEATSGLIRYLDVALSDVGTHVLVPIGHARVERRGKDDARVRLKAAARDDLEAIPSFEPRSAEFGESELSAALAACSRLFHGERYYAHPAFDHGGLFAGEHPILRRPLPTAHSTRVGLLSQLVDYEVAEGEPDIRGWRVVSADGRQDGVIEDLMVDPVAGKVLYALVTLAASAGAVLVPVGYLRLAADRSCVRTPALAAEDLSALPRYEAGEFTRAHELRIQERLEELLDNGRRYQRADFRLPAALSDERLE